MQTLSATQRDTLTAAAEKYHETVYSAIGYLLKRGLWDEETVNGFRLGYVREPEHGHELFRGRLCIPYLTPSGVVDLKFRCIEDHNCKEEEHVKYLGLSGSEAHLYNVQALHDARMQIFVTEGELDAATATVASCPAVGISGAQKWKAHYTHLLDDFEEVVILADGDDAGREFAHIVRTHVERTRVVYFNDGMDPNSFYVAHGKEEFRKYVNAGDYATV